MCASGHVFIRKMPRAEMPVEAYVKIWIVECFLPTGLGGVEGCLVRSVPLVNSLVGVEAPAYGATRSCRAHPSRVGRCLYCRQYVG